MMTSEWVPNGDNFFWIQNNKQITVDVDPERETITSYRIQGHQHVSILSKRRVMLT